MWKLRSSSPSGETTSALHIRLLLCTKWTPRAERARTLGCTAGTVPSPNTIWRKELVYPTVRGLDRRQITPGEVCLLTSVSEFPVTRQQALLWNELLCNKQHKSSGTWAAHGCWFHTDRKESLLAGKISSKRNNFCLFLLFKAKIFKSLQHILSRFNQNLFDWYRSAISLNKVVQNVVWGTFSGLKVIVAQILFSSSKKVLKFSVKRIQVDVFSRSVKVSGRADLVNSSSWNNEHLKSLKSPKNIQRQKKTSTFSALFADSIF